MINKCLLLCITESLQFFVILQHIVNKKHILKFFYWLIWEREKGRRERHCFVIPLINAFIGWFSPVPWLETEPATLVYRPNALTNWATQPSPKKHFLIIVDCILLLIHAQTPHFFQFCCCCCWFLLACLLHLSHSTHGSLSSNPHVTSIASPDCVSLYVSTFPCHCTHIYEHVHEGWSSWLSLHSPVWTCA